MLNSTKLPNKLNANSPRSLGALPPLQRLVLAKLELAKRMRRRLELEQAALQRHQANLALANASIEGQEAPKTADEGSLVLDRGHVISDLYYKRRRFKVYWGGRGGVKSWGAAEALVRKATTQPLRILCMREFQNSIADSSHRLLKDTIIRLGLESWFTITEAKITSRAGAEFTFKGMHGKEQSLRSFEGIDILWIEEAQSFSAGSWVSIEPTIRKGESEIWVTYNLINENDATHRMFYKVDGTLTMPESELIVHKVTYLDNPYFPGSVLEKIMLRMREQDFDLYEHVWLGMPQKKSNSIIFSGKYEVRPFDWELVASVSERPFLGADQGFADDPATLVRSHITEGQRAVEAGLTAARTLWITHAVFGKHVDIDALPALYAHVSGYKDWHIKSDSARPEVISFLNRQGLAMSAAEKWDGSVKDGIAHLRSFDKIVIRQPLPGEHPTLVEGLNAMAVEAYMYRYKVDPKQVDERGQPLVLPIVVDKFNHGWDAVRYSLDGYIQRSGEIGMWERLGAAQ